MVRREIVYANIENPGVAETHLHTRYGSDDGRLNAPRIAFERVKQGVNVVSVTAHNDLTPALIVADYFGDEDRIVTGEEVSVYSEGSRYEEKHLIGLFLKDEIPEGVTVFEAVERIIEQDGIVVIPHPGNRSFRIASMRFDECEELIKRYPGVRFGFEVYNASIRDMAKLSRVTNIVDTNHESLTFFREHSQELFATGGSDGHFNTLGFGTTLFDGDTASDLKTAMREGKTGVAIIDRPQSRNANDYLSHKVREFRRHLGKTQSV